MTLNISNPCEFLEWDSEFFSSRIARVSTKQVDQGKMNEIFAWCNDHRIKCLYYLADAADTACIHCAENSGFNLVDMRATLINSRLDENKENSGSAFYLRPFCGNDLPYLLGDVILNHNDSRFYRDSNFGKHRADKMYQVWMEKCCTEHKDSFFVAESAGQITGYIACAKNELEKQGIIILAGVNTKWRNKGVGTALIAKAISYFISSRAITGKVVTQGANIKAMRLYTSNGFLPISLEYWFHKWFKE